MIEIPREEIRDYFRNKQIQTIGIFQSSSQLDLIPEIQPQRIHDSQITELLANCAQAFQREHPSKV